MYTLADLFGDISPLMLAVLVTPLGAALALGVIRSWKLIRRGGCLGIVGGIVGFIPYLLAIGVVLAGFQQYLNELHPPCRSTICHLGTPSAGFYSILIFLIGLVPVGLGFGIQMAFMRATKVVLSTEEQRIY